MKFTPQSKRLLQEFAALLPHQYKSPAFTPMVTRVFTNLYEELCEADQYAHTHMHQITVTKSSHYVEPRVFGFKAFPSSVASHIQSHIRSCTTFTFSLFARNIRIHWMQETEPSLSSTTSTSATSAVRSILMWLYILHKHASSKCAQSLTVYLYLTSLKKRVPRDARTILGQDNVNTAFTTSCPQKNAEIVVYRKEEWFKVFMHETFHTFGMDFSGMNNQRLVTQCILSLFPVQSEVFAFEAYTEMWAELMNVLFCSFHSIGRRHNALPEFLSHTDSLLTIERAYSFFQMNKVLRHMALTYDDLFLHPRMAAERYRETTNVLSYFILKTVLFSSYPMFIAWCATNHRDRSIFDFTKTEPHLVEFCTLIAILYRSREMRTNAQTMNALLSRTNLTGELRDNMRMTICELG